MKKNFFLFLLIILVGCGCRDTTEIQAEKLDTSNAENLTIYPSKQNVDTVLLKKKKYYGNTKDVFFGTMTEFAVDGLGRVYVADGGWGSRSLHVYNPDGSYLMKLAGEGKGPAEFLSLNNLHFNSDKVVFYDSDLKRIKVFKVNPPKLSNTILVETRNLVGLDQSMLKFPVEINLQSDGTFLVGFQEFPRIDNSGKRIKSYYHLDSKFNVISEKLIDLKAKKYTHSNREQTTGKVQFKVMKYFPFFERSFFIPSRDGGFYTVESPNFLVKKYDKYGKYISSFSHPYKSPKVTREDAYKSVNSGSEGLAQSIELPEFWPVITNIFFDDENRFWISTITENEESYEWWVLKESGEVIGKFELPGNRFRPLEGLENIIVKNNYLYMREVDSVNNSTKIVRYEIEFRSIR